MNFAAHALAMGILFAGCGSALAQPLNLDCSGFDPKKDKPMSQWSEPSANSCAPKTKTRNGIEYTLPDPDCTPGAINPGLKLSVLKKAGFHTLCERDKASSAHAKDKTYSWYGIAQPTNNTGKKQVCEKDHLISIEIGGADTLDNIWPQCGPDHKTLDERYFKQKDLVENYLAAEIRKGHRKLAEVQEGIARDWTQYLDDATTYYKTHKKRAGGG